MGLAFVPLYIRYLGMEAYGLIGLFAMMQAWLALLDLGMSPTLSREMARFTAGSHSAQSIRDLLRSVEIVCFALATAICLAVWSCSAWLASDWLKADRLSPAVVEQAISIIAFVIALRFVESIYRSALIGMQEQVWYNATNAVLATLRSGGAIVVLVWMSPTIEAFFLWQALMSLLTVSVLAIRVNRRLPASPAPASFSRQALNDITQFAGGMTGITLLAILLTQVDKLLLSRLLPLETFGMYTLASTIAGTLYMVVAPITTAMFPRLVELVPGGDQGRLVATYHRGAQLVSVLTAPAAMLLAFFGEGVIFAWSGNSALARQVGPILAALVVGSYLNGLMYMPYQLQLAYGWTSLALRTNVAAVVILIPAIFWLVPRFGPMGAAWLWIVLNSGYVLIAIHFMHRRILPLEKWRWYFADVGGPSLAALAVMLLATPLKPRALDDRGAWLAFLLASLGCGAIASITAAADLRTRAFVSLCRVRRA
jgi:O-antigen/teichoic acid export membrane protein